jgi:hypothetical protein
VAVSLLSQGRPQIQAAAATVNGTVNAAINSQGGRAKLRMTAVPAA